ncbi:hypothetical protein HY379_00905 [Candidatus Saccharibacteria bacterium]|nr:hypothetical protein [Candidatus Saccharibacteria bacterium]
MERETIAVDVDDVIAAHAEAFVEFSNECYGTHLAASDYTEHWHRLWRADNKEVERRATEFHTPERTIRYQRMHDAAVVLGDLSLKRDLVIVTARPYGLVETTRQWLDQNFPNVFSGYNFVPIWTPGNKITKADICKQIGADYLVDDLARHCNVAAEVGVQALLFGDYPWNQDDDLHPSVVRIKNWPEVGKYFDEKS